MQNRILSRIATSFFLLTATLAAVIRPGPGASPRVALRTGWQIESSCKVKEKGEIISTTAFKPQGWLAATVPTTVLAAQVAAGKFPDPYFGINLRQIPGTTYPINKMFANLPMPEDSPYTCSWWYRTEFSPPAEFRGSQVWLHFGGISYRANVWLNGRKIGDAKDIAGTWREFEFNVTSNLTSGTDVLAVEVFAQKEDDLGITFVDWNPMPPDKDMGLWRPVYLEASGPVAIRHPFVTAKLDPDLKTAHISASAELENTTDRPLVGKLMFSVQPGWRTMQVSLAPHATTTVDIPTGPYQMTVQNPKLWWPYGMGAQELYWTRFRLLIDDAVSDSQEVTFAIRSVTSELTSDGHRLFKINGRPFLVRGGGWTPDMMLRQSPERLRAEFNYVRDMNLNTVRLEGKLESDEFFDMADRMGIMVMAGWCCCDHWEHWDKWKPEDYEISAASLADQVRRLRNHPSLLVWLNGSDNPPPPRVESRYLEVLKQYQWPNPVISSATGRPTSVTGKSGVKMTGPYDFVPPDYWLLDKAKLGGAYGFNTETSPGPAIPPAQSIRKMLPPEHWWPIDDWWNYHAGLGRFTQMDIYNRALAARYGEPKSLEEYATKSQAAAYDGERAMFEAYTRNRYTVSAAGALADGPATGVIQWMLNNAWPSMIWHLYDYFLQPAGGYFGAKKANQPLHVMYAYDDGSVVVSNGGQQAYKDLRLRARVLNFDLTEKFSREVRLDAPPDSVQKLFDIPALDGLSTTYFLDLRLLGGDGRPLSSNFYWLSSRPDVLDWEKSKGHYTPEQQYADLKLLNSLPRVGLSLQTDIGSKRPNDRITFKVRNPTQSLAFMVRLRLTDGPKGEDIVPVLWEDNYFSLLPGESRSLSAVLVGSALTTKDPTASIEGWNVEPLIEVNTFHTGPKAK